MPIQSWIIVISWLAFILYWGFSAFGVKKDISGGRWWRGKFLTVRLLILVVLILTVLIEKRGLNFVSPFKFNGTFGTWGLNLGTAICVLGISFAIWARYHLGKNWSSHPTLKEGHELVTSGPYRFVRHPIYTGMLFSIIGSIFAIGWIWAITFLVAVLIFINRVRIEESLMMKQFPDQYPEYKRKTKVLIPFVW